MKEFIANLNKSLFAKKVTIENAIDAMVENAQCRATIGALLWHCSKLDNGTVAHISLDGDGKGFEIWADSWHDCPGADALYTGHIDACIGAYLALDAKGRAAVLHGCDTREGYWRAI